MRSVSPITMTPAARALPLGAIGSSAVNPGVVERVLWVGGAGIPQVSDENPFQFTLKENCSLRSQIARYLAGVHVVDAGEAVHAFGDEDAVLDAVEEAHILTFVEPIDVGDSVSHVHVPVAEP